MYQEEQAQQIDPAMLDQLLAQQQMEQQRVVNPEVQLEQKKEQDKFQKMQHAAIEAESQAETAQLNAFVKQGKVMQQGMA